MDKINTARYLRTKYFGVSLLMGWLFFTGISSVRAIAGEDDGSSSCIIMGSHHLSPEDILFTLEQGTIMELNAIAGLHRWDVFQIVLPNKEVFTAIVERISNPSVSKSIIQAGILDYPSSSFTITLSHDEMSAALIIPEINQGYSITATNSESIVCFSEKEISLQVQVERSGVPVF